MLRPIQVGVLAGDVDRDAPETYVQTLAEQRGLRLYDAPAGSADAFGFILSDCELTPRQLERIEAEYWDDPKPED